MKSRRRVLTRSVWLMAGALALFSIYLQVGLFPGQTLRGRVLDRIEEIAGRRITFSRAIFMPGMGLSLEDFRIAGAAGPSLFSAESVRVDVKILPFLFQKKIIVRNLMLESPVFE